MILGEPQILGQLKTAYRNAVEKGVARVIVNRLLHKAFSVAKRVRTETAIASSAVSISYAAVELARKIFTDLSNHRALLIGAGEMAELAATHLLSAGVRDITVVNRTLAKGEELARQFKGRAMPFEELHQALLETDIVISSTGSPTAIIRARDMKDVLRQRRHKPIFFIDIAVPRDIDPDINGLDNIYLYDIDDLKEVVEENLAGRQQEAQKARTIVTEEVNAFMRWRDGLALQPTIVALLDQGNASLARNSGSPSSSSAPIRTRRWWPSSRDWPAPCATRSITNPSAISNAVPRKRGRRSVSSTTHAGYSTWTRTWSPKKPIWTASIPAATNNGESHARIRHRRNHP